MKRNYLYRALIFSMFSMFSMLPLPAFADEVSPCMPNNGQSELLSFLPESPRRVAPPADAMTCNYREVSRNYIASQPQVAAYGYDLLLSSCEKLISENSKLTLFCS